ncbi:hypothetical protein ACOME3_009577 [Neoechinorhynchus agilis]
MRSNNLIVIVLAICVLTETLAIERILIGGGGGFNDQSGIPQTTLLRHPRFLFKKKNKAYDPYKKKKLSKTKMAAGAALTAVGGTMLYNHMKSRKKQKDKYPKPYLN